MGPLLHTALALPCAVLLASVLAGCPGAPVTCRTSRDCAAGEACVDMACVPRTPSPDAGEVPDAHLELPDAVVGDDAWSDLDAGAPPPDAFVPPDAFAPADAPDDAFRVDPCADGMTGGDESDVDCGGGACAPCEDGRACRVASDCASASCSGARCGPPPVSCTNGAQDGEETAPDCGGAMCAPCADGLGCALPRDCRSAVCDASRCAVPSCADGARNAAETDVDCGGGVCSPCPDARGCTTGTDCTSRVCTDSRCAAPSCSDGLRNGIETDVDCGGAGCPGCAPGGSCMISGDCASMACSGGICLDCIDTSPLWTAPASCMGPACRATVAALRAGDARRLDVSWTSSFLTCPGCTDALSTSAGSLSSGASCVLCANAAVSRVVPVGGNTLEMTIESPGCAPCVETLTVTGPTVTSTGCTVASCGPQAIRQIRASGNQLELDWGDCGCTQVLTFTGERTCS